jgi:molybdenum cofactor cytidylyltransferase
MINAVVLAAGESKRMGKPKALLRFEEQTFLQHIISVLQKSALDKITVVLGASADTILKSVDLSGTQIVVNKNCQDGQLSSLITAIESTPEDTEAVLVCLVDMPFISDSTIKRLIGEFKETLYPIVVPLFGGKRGHPVLFSRSVFGDLRKAPPNKGARYVLYSDQDRVLEVPVHDEGILVSVDTPDGYKSRFGRNP